MSAFARAAALGASMLCAACATDYVARTHDVRSAYSAYQYDRALESLEKKQVAEIDRLLWLLDKGAVLHSAGRWQDSIAVLSQADELSKNLDFTSVSEEAGTLITNEGTRTYRGEDFEKLMISVLQALNYAELGDDEGALVEVRRVNERLEKMISQEKKPYEQLAIARYLGGVLYEDQHEWDSAAIDYLKAAELSGNLGSASEAVLRLAKQTGRDDAYEKLRKRYAKDGGEGPAKKDGQVVVVIEAGQVPEKKGSYQEKGAQLIAVPYYPDRLVPIPKARVQVASQSVEAATVTSLDAVAKLHLNERLSRLVAKSMASLALKAGAAAAVGAATKNEGVGVLTFGLLTLTQQADVRSWLALPGEFQVARASVAPGKVTVVVSLGGKSQQREVEVKAGRISVVVVRLY